MHRSRRFSVLVLVALGAVAACGGASRPAADVGGTEISQQDVVDELEAIRGNADYVAAIEGTEEAPGQPVLGEEDDAFDSAFVAIMLGNRILYSLMGNEVDERGLSADDECRAAARDSVIGRLVAFSPSGDGEAVFEGFDEGYQDYLVDRETDALLLQGDLIGQPCVGGDAARQYYEEHADEFVQACAAHILVDTPEQAAEIETLLDQGADFAQLAAERSTDAGSAAQGGELPCVSAGQFVPEFDAAVFSQPIGEVGDPVQSDFGYHVIRVDARDQAPFEDVRDEVVQRMAQEASAAFQAWLVSAVDATDIEVDPRYGTWDPQQGQIVRPPTDSASTTVEGGAPAEG